MVGMALARETETSTEDCIEDRSVSRSLRQKSHIARGSTEVGPNAPHGLPTRCQDQPF